MDAPKTYLAPRRVLTERLELRPFTLADHPDYARITADPEVMRYVGAGTPSTPDIAWRTIAGILGHWELLGYGLYALATREGRLVGHVGFIDVHGWPGFELGWLLGREHWGKGYAFEAAQAALEIAQVQLGKARVISLIRAGNAPSIRLAERLGAAKEGEVELMGSAAGLYVHRPRR